MQLIAKNSGNFTETRRERPPAASPAAAAVEAPPPPNWGAGFALVGQVGGELSGHVTVMQQFVQGFNATRKISRAQLQLLEEAIEASALIARQSQQIARLAEGRVRQSHERLKLHEIIGQALDERTTRLHRQGTAIYRNIKPVEIIVDPGLLSLLIEAALDWATSAGQRISVSLGIKNWPEYGMLTLRTSPAVVDSRLVQAPTASDNVHWHLLTQVASAMGVTVSRDVAGGEVNLTAEFARTVKSLEGLTAVELDVGGDSSQHSTTKALAGLRILLVTTDAATRAEVHKVCSMLGLLVDTVPTADKAVHYVETDPPHLIIIDEKIRDARFDGLIEDLRRHAPNFGLLEIAEGHNTFEISSWMSDSMTRISRDVLRDQLASVLTLELAKAL